MVEMMRILCLLVVLCAGCNGSVTVKPDPWAEYETALNVWTAERSVLAEYERACHSPPTEDEVATLGELRGNVEHAKKHLWEIRDRMRHN